MRQLITTIFRRWALPVLLASSLGACQRASYQFQNSVATDYQPAPQVSVPESAEAVAAAAQPAEKANGSLQHLRRRARRPARLPRILHVKAPVVLTHLSPNAAAHLVAHASHLQQEPGPAAKPVRYRSRGVAILLAVLAVTYLPLSLHNFYLGYYGRGAAAITLVAVGLSLLWLGLLGTVFSGGGLAVVGYIGLAMLGGWFVWQLSDLVRLITGDLTPKDGEYNPGFFQTRPDAYAKPLAH